jgi:hypothetical protein
MPWVNFACECDSIYPSNFSYDPSSRTLLHQAQMAIRPPKINPFLCSDERSSAMECSRTRVSRIALQTNQCLLISMGLRLISTINFAAILPTSPLVPPYSNPSYCRVGIIGGPVFPMQSPQPLWHQKFHFLTPLALPVSSRTSVLCCCSPKRSGLFGQRGSWRRESCRGIAKTSHRSRYLRLIAKA